MNYQFPLVATNRGGDTRLFYDADSFRAFAYDRSNGGVGGYWLEAYITFNSGKRRLERLHSRDTISWWSGSAENNWIVRDNAGRVVDKEHFKVSYSWTFPRWERARRAAEQGLPIPGTGHCRRYKHSRQGAWTKNGKNGAHNQRKGIKLFEDPLIRRGNLEDL